MKNFLQTVIKHKRKEIREKKKREYHLFSRPKNSLSPFLDAITHSKESVPLIAEIKLKSPVSGQLGSISSVEKRVLEYEKAGVEALSIVIDEKFFGGHLQLIEIIRKKTKLPILAKDFIIDPYQLYEIKKAGADAVLLIVKIVDDTMLDILSHTCQSLDLEMIIEVNSQADLNRIRQRKACMVAVNARNLDNFSLDIGRACGLIKQISREHIVLGFSGIQKKEDVMKYSQAGAKAVLIGTVLMKTGSVNSLIKELKQV